MAKSNHLYDKKAAELIVRELQHFKELIKGHEKLLEAVGRL